MDLLRLGSSSAAIGAAFLLCAASIGFGARVVYVDRDASGANDGSSWEDACNSLQDALAAAAAGDKIRVAQGVYRPDQGAGVAPGDRNATFQLVDGVVLKGGYAGFGEPDPDARDTRLFETILSGDLAGNDGEAPGSTLDNCYHVVTGAPQPEIADRTTEVLEGFTITAGSARGFGADSRGGGMYCNSDATVIACKFVANTAIYGGAVHCGPSWCCYTNPRFVECSFLFNMAGDGGAICIGDSGPELVKCVISANEAFNRGGGVMFDGDNRTVMINCLLNANWAGTDGAGIYDNADTQLTMTNCTLVSNWARGMGGGIYTFGSPRLTNCIIWDSRDIWGGGQASQIYATSWEPVVNCSCIEGWTGDYGGVGNTGADPRFVDADGADNQSGTEDDNLGLQPDSPCIDAGDNTAVPPSLVTDIAGKPRLANHIVDIGAYERHSFVISSHNVVFAEGTTSSFTVALVEEPAQPVEVSVFVKSGDPDITVAAGATLTFDPLNYSVPQPVLLSAAEDEDYLTDTAILWVMGAGLLDAVAEVTATDDELVPPILYVDRRASGAQDGWSWTDAFTRLDDALETAAAYPAVEEVRVSQGTYKPTEAFSGDRDATFEIVSGVSVRGGYAGLGSPDPNARDIRAFETMLSGDIDGDDGPDFSNNQDNSRSVVFCSGVDATAVLDGFTITAGNAVRGGGLWCIDAGPTVIDCTFIGNYAQHQGGAMAGSGGRPTLTRCAFVSNKSKNTGGAISGGDGLTLTGCTFENNSAGGEGGAIFRGRPTMRRCTFVGNSGGSGGALNIMFGTLTSCRLHGNKGTFGGAIYGGQPTLINCIFSANTATFGGAVHAGAVRAVNCTFVANHAGSRGGGVDTHLISHLPALTNCIFWANTADGAGGENAQLCIEGNKHVIDYSCIEGWTGAMEGTGNFAADPCFADPDNRDYHLKSQAGRWDDRSRTWVKDELTSACIDAGDPVTPIGYEPFPNGGIVNIGAYGATLEASKSYFGEPVCEKIAAGDINGDCKVNFSDFCIMALHWFEVHQQ